MNTHSASTDSDAVKSTTEKIGEITGKVQDTFRQTQERLGEFQRDLTDKTRYAAQSTDTYVREKPWSAVCAAVGIGFVLGLIVGRR